MLYSVFELTMGDYGNNCDIFYEDVGVFEIIGVVGQLLSMLSLVSIAMYNTAV